MTEREIISALVSAMKQATDNGNVDHLDACDDAGKFWYVALVAGEAFLAGKDVNATLKSYIERNWPS